MNNYYAFGINYEFIENDQLDTVLPSIKQYALLFDKICLPTLDLFIKNPQSVSEKALNEAIWLKDQNIIFDLLPSEYSIFFDIDEQNIDNDPYLKKLINETLDSSDKWMFENTLFLKELNREELGRLLNEKLSSIDYKQKVKTTYNYLLRTLAYNYERKEDVTAIPILASSDFSNNYPNTIKSNVISIVLNYLPIPDNNTPWEEIIDYRNDKKNQENLLSLRRWITKISKASFSASEIKDEIEGLMNDFQQNMRLKRIHANTEAFEAIVTAPLEIIEDLVRLKFSSIPKPFFALNKRRISLMEAEITSPGREIAYLINSNKEFN